VVALKTYSHLAGGRRMPSDYQLVTTQLLYHPTRGLEVEVPLGAWYRRHLTGSPLRCSDWERFEDPRATTYASYTALQSRQESHVEGVLRSIEARDYDRQLPPAALALWARALAPLRFACHGLQMIAAYLGQMAPSGRVAVAALFQAADETRRLERLALRLAQLRRAATDLARVGDDSRALWQHDPAWQPLRRLVERLLVAWDWGEALVALNVCAKPLLDELAVVELPAAARAAGDYLCEELTFSLGEDCRWHRAWTEALLAVALADAPANREVLARWTAAWMPAVDEAAAGLAGLLGERGPTALAAARQRAAAFRVRVGAEPPEGERS